MRLLELSSFEGIVAALVRILAACLQSEGLEAHIDVLERIGSRGLASRSSGMVENHPAASTQRAP